MVPIYGLTVHGLGLKALNLKDYMIQKVWAIYHILSEPRYSVWTLRPFQALLALKEDSELKTEGKVDVYFIRSFPSHLSLDRFGGVSSLFVLALVCKLGQTKTVVALGWRICVSMRGISTTNGFDCVVSSVDGSR